jgi:hypothetical protein
MGGGSWSHDYYEDRAKERARSGASTFAHHEAVAAKPIHEQKVHVRLDPKGVKVRESRDSLEHPESIPIAIMLDVTGSMQSVPKEVHSRLPNMHTIATKIGILDPQFLFGAVGDEFSDRGSLQIGQFESDNRMADDLEHFWMEGGGGGSNEESYQNAIFFFARHTEIDSLSKRNKKGYLFLLGDEHPYKVVKSSTIETILGYNLEGRDIPTSEVIEECQKKYNIFFIIPSDTNHGRDASLAAAWKKHLGDEHVLIMSSASDICELVATTVGVCEGLVTLDQAKVLLSGSGVSSKTASSVGDSLYNLVKARGLPTGDSKVRRL